MTLLYGQRGPMTSRTDLANFIDTQYAAKRGLLRPIWCFLALQAIVLCCAWECQWRSVREMSYDPSAERYKKSQLDLLQLIAANSDRCQL